ncbi:restriction endonuclease subunit S [Empedobacter falsenii]
MAYYLMLNNFKHYIVKKSVGATAISIRKPMLEKFHIPIPCPDNPEKSLEIQQEIVRVLDELTSLTNQLTTELETERQNRKKQFEFFREHLFSFEEGKAEWKTLGSECDIFTGGEAPSNCIKGILPNDKFVYPIYGNGMEVYGYTDSYRIDKDAVTISSIGANTGNVYYRNAFFTPIIRLKVVIPKKDNLISKFIFHYLNTIKINSKSSSVPNMNASDVKKIKIPIPSLAEQERIVKFLDQFDATHTAIEEEITKEIKLRTQQYEYYREKLLSFPQN